MKNTKRKKYIITVSYGNYRTGVGGTDKYILSQERLLAKYDISTIHVFPLQIKARGYWGVCLDGEFQGVYSSERFIAYLYSVSKKGEGIVGILIHHLKQVDIQMLRKVLISCNAKIYFYLHDYMTICPYNGLVNSNNEYCGATFPNVEKCKECHYFSSTLSHSRIQEFFLQFADRMTFVAPSLVAKEEWSKAYKNWSEKVVVINHQVLDGEYQRFAYDNCNQSIINVAYVGYQSAIKGWEEFVDAATKISEQTDSIRFFQFGSGQGKFDFITQVEVDFQKNLDAMIDALRKYNIHAVVLWSIWPETYSFTYYESLAANAFVITNGRSGNICKQVMERKNGIVADDLMAVLVEKKLRKLIADYVDTKICGPLFLRDNDEIYWKHLEKNDAIYLTDRGRRIDVSWGMSLLIKLKAKVFKGVKR